jgi:putative membrane protein
MNNNKELYMKKKMLLLMLLLATASSSAVLANTPMNEPRGLQAGYAQAEQDKILEVVIDIDKNEMNAAKAAMNRPVNPEVKAFAQKLYADHEKNLVETEALGKAILLHPQESSLSTAIKQKGKEGLAQLNAMNTEQFQLAYAKAMVKGHKEALSFLDKAIEKAQDNRLKQHLQKTRVTVLLHLKMAENLQSKLQQRT